jgi:hypothetical protein
MKAFLILCSIVLFGAVVARVQNSAPGSDGPQGNGSEWRWVGCRCGGLSGFVYHSGKLAARSYHRHLRFVNASGPEVRHGLIC